MKYICPLILVSDIARSRDLYENVLGQKVMADYGENLTFEGAFSIHLREHFSSLINEAEIKEKANNFELYFEHDELEEIAEQIRALGLEFVHELREQPWKQRVVRFYDYDKNMIEIGESMEHVAYRLYRQDYPVDEIMKITYMDNKSVNDAIDQYSNKNGE